MTNNTLTEERRADMALLSRAIELSGLSARQFAIRELTRDPRNVFRWLKGQYGLPKEVRDRCRAIVAERAPELQLSIGSEHEDSLT